MLFKAILAVAAGASIAVAQRPSNTSVCDYYTTALFMTNNATNQLKLVTAIVNRAVIGNTSATTAGIAVPGILNPAGTYNGTAVNLVPYFSGALASTNRGGSSGQSVNFLDGGGAAPLAAGMAANKTSGNQYTLLTHLYEYFGAILNCSTYGSEIYPAYAGGASMYEVHKFMKLSPAEMGYFITQVGLSAASFGAASSDVTAAGTALNALFNNRCGPNITVIPAQGAQEQSMCGEDSCPIATGGNCSAYATIAEPQNATSSSGGGGGSSTTASGTGASSGSGTGTGTGTAAGGSSTSKPSTASRDIVSVAAILGAAGLGAFCLL